MLLSYFKSQRTEMQGGYIICPGRHCERWGELVSKLMTTHPALCHRGISRARDQREEKLSPLVRDPLSLRSLPSL